MTDIKEIIRVLGFIQEYFDNHADEQEPDCRKELFRDWSEITLDAITLLKAQENPRLLTISDFDNNPNADSRGFLPAWIEYRRDGDWFEYWNDIDDEWSPVNRYSFCGEGYRCWTSKPTDDQRKNTPFNESD